MRTSGILDKEALCVILNVSYLLSGSNPVSDIVI